VSTFGHADDEAAAAAYADDAAADVRQAGLITTRSQASGCWRLRSARAKRQPPAQRRRRREPLMSSRLASSHLFYLCSTSRANVGHETVVDGWRRRGYGGKRR
jgi:hypothetical protein